MANKAKKDRQAVLDSIRKDQQRAERGRGLRLVAVSVALGVLIIGAAAFKPIKDWYDQRSYAAMSLSEIGAGADVCQDVTTKPAAGNQDHVAPETPLTYEDSPPAFGTHWEIWDSMERKLYTKSDRPELGELVHNLEHGFNILWYDETIADDGDAMRDLRGIASKFAGNEDLRNKFKAVPWTSEDGAPFPDDQHIAFTHWSMGGPDATSEEDMVGVWQYCSEISGEALQKFFDDYPYMDSPEPNSV